MVGKGKRQGGSGSVEFNGGNSTLTSDREALGRDAKTAADLADRHRANGNTRII
jgi:hypothetical protein